MPEKSQNKKGVRPLPKKKYNKNVVINDIRYALIESKPGKKHGPQISKWTKPINKADNSTQGSQALMARRNRNGPGRRPNGNGPRRRHNGNGPGRRPNGNGPGRRPNGNGPGRRPNGNGPGRRPNGNGPGRRPNGNGLGRRPNGNGPGRRPNGNGPGRRPNGNGPGRRPLGRNSTSRAVMGAPHIRQGSFKKNHPHSQKIMNRRDTMDVRFDHKFLQRDVVAQRLEREIARIVPQIIDNVSGDVVDYFNDYKDQEEKKRQREIDRKKM